MADEDEDLWFDALAGITHAEADSEPATREARKLREALVLYAAPAETPVRVPDPERESALLKRAEREGLISARGPIAISWYAAIFRAPARYAYAALACIAMTVGFLMWSPPDGEVVRGSHYGVVRVVASDPAAFKRQIIGELREAGVTATGYERLGAQGIDADLPQPVSPQVRAVLQRHRIDVPTDGVLKIEITQKRTP
jgi:hypothetical protein